MTGPRCPAAYICVANASCAQAQALRQYAVAEVTNRRGWSAPVIYLDEDDPGMTQAGSPVLARLGIAS